MSIEITGTFNNGKFPRILHNGNRFQVQTVTASDEENTDYPGIGADNGATVDRWRPFANLIPSPSAFDEEWTASGITVGSDGQTLAEDGTTGLHRIFDSYTLTAEEHVLAFEVERQTVPEVQIFIQDSGATDYTCFFDLRDGTVGTSSNSTGRIVDLGNNRFLISIRFTPAAGTGTVNFRLSNGSENTSYTGSSSNTIRVLNAYAHVSSAQLRYDLFTAQAGDCIAIAAHNLGTAGGRINIQHDSNNDDTWTSIDSLEPTDNSPIMFFFDAITSSRWRIAIDRGAMPEIGVFRVGAALQFERPFYGGFTVPRMARNTEVLGNISGSGGLLGRSKKRTTLNAQYQWSNLTYDWVRANLDGTTGLIQSAEAEPLFVAWRPELTEDVEYLMRATVEAPTAQGQRDLHSFSMSGEALAYE